MGTISHLFDLFILWLGAQNAPVLYLVLFLFSILENLFPPVPGDMVTVFGAFLVGSGKLSFLLVYISTTAGSTLGFYTLYLLSRAAEVEFFEKRNIKWLSRKNINKAKHAIGRFGYAAILANRFLPGVRSAISITAGILKLPPLVVLPLSFASAAVWNLIWISAGSAFGKTWEETKQALEDFAAHYNLAAGIFLIAILILVSAWIILRRRRKHRSRK
jgi:membrane protein DedA with SNARE-associated domain